MFVKVKELESKHHKWASVLDLPEGANDEAAWTRLVIPNFINIILASKDPWIITDDTVVLELQRVWNHVYGRRV